MPFRQRPIADVAVLAVPFPCATCCRAPRALLLPQHGTMNEYWTAASTMTSASRSKGSVRSVVCLGGRPALRQSGPQTPWRMYWRAGTVKREGWPVDLPSAAALLVQTVDPSWDVLAALLEGRNPGREPLHQFR